MSIQLPENTLAYKWNSWYFQNKFEFLTKYWLSVFLISKSNNSLKATAAAKNYHGDG